MESAAALCERGGWTAVTVGRAGAGAGTAVVVVVAMYMSLVVAGMCCPRVVHVSVCGLLGTGRKDWENEFSESFRMEVTARGADGVAASLLFSSEEEVIILCCIQIQLCPTHDGLHILYAINH